MSGPVPWPAAEQDAPALPRTLPPVAPDDVVQIVATPPFRRLLNRWLDKQGLVLFRIPVEDDLPTYGIAFREVA